MSDSWWELFQYINKNSDLLVALEEKSGDQQSHSDLAMGMLNVMVYSVRTAARLNNELCFDFHSKANRCPWCLSVHIFCPGSGVYVCSDGSYYICPLQESRLVMYTIHLQLQNSSNFIKKLV